MASKTASKRKIITLEQIDAILKGSRVGDTALVMAEAGEAAKGQGNYAAYMGNYLAAAQTLMEGGALKEKALTPTDAHKDILALVQRGAAQDGAIAPGIAADLAGKYVAPLVTKAAEPISTRAQLKGVDVAGSISAGLDGMAAGVIGAANAYMDPLVSAHAAKLTAGKSPAEAARIKGMLYTEAGAALETEIKSVTDAVGQTRDGLLRAVTGAGSYADLLGALGSASGTRTQLAQSLANAHSILEGGIAKVYGQVAAGPAYEKASGSAAKSLAAERSKYLKP